MGYKNDDPCIKKAYPDERLFVLMARDPAAAKVVLYWIVRSFETQPTEKLREAFECAIEMRDNVKKFYDRKEQDKKKKIADQERDEFERWKKMKDGKGYEIPELKGNHEAGVYEEAINKNEFVDMRFAQRFAEYLDNNLPGQTGQGFNSRMLEEFIKTLSSR